MRSDVRGLKLGVFQLFFQAQIEADGLLEPLGIFLA